MKEDHRVASRLTNVNRSKKEQKGAKRSNKEQKGAKRSKNTWGRVVGWAGVGWGRVVGWGGEETPQDLPPEFLFELNTNKNYRVTRFQN